MQVELEILDAVDHKLRPRDANLDFQALKARLQDRRPASTTVSVKLHFSNGKESTDWWVQAIEYTDNTIKVRFRDTLSHLPGIICNRGDILEVEPRHVIEVSM